MFIVDDKIVSAELFTTQFICNLSVCKGACCWEGDFGAPVSEEEAEVIESIKTTILPMLSAASRDIIVDQGTTTHDSYLKQKVTPLHADGSCAYLVRDENGGARCVFEKAWEEDKTTFKKPSSCHLYPVRVNQNPETGFEALNYDEWEICKAACSLGAKHQTPVFRFVKEAIVRRYGSEFYDQLEDIYHSYFSK